MIAALLILFLALNATDAALTLYGIRNGLREFNPVLSKLFAKVGVKAGLALTKIPVSLGAIYCVVVEQAGLFFVSALAIPYAGLVAWDIYHLRLAQQV